MKTLIILVNIALAGLLTASVFSALRNTPESEGAPVRRQTAHKKSVQPKKNPSAAAGGKTEAPPRDEQIALILKSDLFNPERTPNAANGRRNTRAELSLVGTFEAGKIKGAVIVVRTNNRQQNPFMRMMMMGGPGGMPPGGRGPGGRGPGVQRFSFGQNNQNNRRNDNTAVKQYVRIGETMTNGYTLVSVSRDRAMLTRGGDKLELELQAPSINQNAARRGGAPRLNATQQLQQAQLATQQMMVRALMEMRSGGNRAPGGGGNRGGGRR